MSKNGRIAVVLILACAAFAAQSLSAATFIVPPDRQMVQNAPVIVVASALGSRTQLNEKGAIETVTIMSMEEVLKGAIEGDTFEIHEPGGVYGNRARMIPGVPRFNDGGRYLLFLIHTGGAWRVLDLVLGKFTFETDTFGRELVIRDAGEIAGWDPDGTPHREQTRGSKAFLDFIRATAKGGPARDDHLVPPEPLIAFSTSRISAARSLKPTATFSPTSYTYDFSAGTGSGMGARWNVFPAGVNYASIGTEPGTDITVAINAAFSAWKTGSNVNYVYAGNDPTNTTNSPCDDPVNGRVDGKNTIAFEYDFANLAPCFAITPFQCTIFQGGFSYKGTLGLGGVSASSGTHVGPNGETFATATEGDVWMNRGIANCTPLFNSGDFKSAVAHEFGHTLGFRHSDEGRVFNSNVACVASATNECSGNAIMVGKGGTIIPTGLNGMLQSWDQDAVAALYTGPSCTAPAITSQPTGASINSGQSATLTVVASGDTPLSYQWYVGNSGTTTNPVSGGTNASLTVSPTTTTTYWVRVTNACGTANSNSATVTVTVCVAPSITTQPGNTSVVSGNSTTLSVVASGTTPLSYQWYVGSPPTTTSPVSGGTGSSLSVSPTSNTTYWVQVTNACGTVNSNAATVTVLPPGSVPRGDANGSGSVTVADIFYLINFLFSGGPGAVSGDANASGSVTVADVFYLINYLFAGGPPPPP